MDVKEVTGPVSLLVKLQDGKDHLRHCATYGEAEKPVETEYNFD